MNQPARDRLILVVEDELTLAQTIELYLRNDGYRTERAGDGKRGLELFRAARPDLVILLFFTETTFELTMPALCGDLDHAGR